MQVKYHGEHCIIVANQDEVNRIIQLALQEAQQDKNDSSLAWEIYTKLAIPPANGTVPGHYTPKTGWQWGEKK